MQDANWNVTALVDNGSIVVERYLYEPYGEMLFLNGSFVGSASTFDNPYTFTGRRHDSETELYCYRNRYYDTQLGRFLRRDPMGYAGSEWNLYEYVDAKPTYYVDPMGLELGDRPFPIPIDRVFPEGECVERIRKGIERILEPGIEKLDPCEANYQWEVNGICGDNWGRCIRDCRKISITRWNLPWDCPIYCPTVDPSPDVAGPTSNPTIWFVIQSRKRCEERCDKKEEECRETAKRRFEKCKRGELNL
ncbi:MAG: RHS repeat-associated core domain-containing protein [Planctomycetia bacterium]|nr:RHS repeat-associated core domain-containing protein [Planctomycetia bacterium]